MKPKKSVLVLSPFFRPNVGGVETHLDDLCEFLRKHSFRTFVLTYQPLVGKKKGLSFEKKKNLEIHRFWWLPNLYYKVEPYPVLDFLYLTPWLLIRTFFFLLGNSKKIDVIHAHGINAAFIAKVLRPIFRKRTVVSTHATYGLGEKPKLAMAVKWILSSADKILTLSRASKQELVEIGLPGTKIDVYTYWVDQKVFRPTDEQKAKMKVGWQNKFVVLFVGRVVVVKGVRELLSAAKITQKGIFYAIAGGGDLDRKVRDFSKKYDNTIFLGRVENKKLPLYYSAADLVIIPSTHEEGFGRVILEALSCGTPVIGANRGAIPEALDESVGKLIKVTSESIGKTVEYFYNNLKELQKLTKNARKYAEEKFSERNVETIIKAYEVSNSRH